MPAHHLHRDASTLRALLVRALPYLAATTGEAAEDLADDVRLALDATGHLVDGDDDADAPPTAPPYATRVREDKELAKQLRACVKRLANNSGWTTLGQLGAEVRHRLPGFNPKSYGCQGLKDLVLALGDTFEVQAFPINDTPVPYVRLRPVVQPTVIEARPLKCDAASAQAVGRLSQSSTASA